MKDRKRTSWVAFQGREKEIKKKRLFYYFFLLFSSEDQKPVKTIKHTKNWRIGCVHFAKLVPSLH